MIKTFTCNDCGGRGENKYHYTNPSVSLNSPNLKGEWETRKCSTCGGRGKVDRDVPVEEKCGGERYPSSSTKPNGEEWNSMCRECGDLSDEPIFSVCDKIVTK